MELQCLFQSSNKSGMIRLEARWEHWKLIVTRDDHRFRYMQTIPADFIVNGIGNGVDRNENTNRSTYWMDKQKKRTTRRWFDNLQFHPALTSTTFFLFISRSAFIEFLFSLSLSLSLWVGGARLDVVRDLSLSEQLSRGFYPRWNGKRFSLPFFFFFFSSFFFSATTNVRRLIVRRPKPRSTPNPHPQPVAPSHPK